MTPLQSIAASGTKLWLDSVDPEFVKINREQGATGATSNPIIISDLIQTGRFDAHMTALFNEGLSDEDVAWQMTDRLVRDAQKVFEPVWKETQCNDGWVSFELDPLLEDPKRNIPAADRAKAYIELGKKWSAGHTNRMIKIPATEGGLLALEELAAAGVTLNVTLIFTQRQYFAARDACWRGAQRRKSTDQFKSVYSIFVSRVDQYTEKHVPTLSPEAQGQVGIVNAKRIWKLNKDFWADKGLKLEQELIFASTGTKKASDAAWKYVEAFAGSDIETNPPATNDAVAKSGRTFTAHITDLPPQSVLDEIDQKVNIQHLEDTLMGEGLSKFAEPQYKLLKTIADKRAQLPTAAK